MLPLAAFNHYREQQRLTVATLSATRRAWSQMGPDFDASWMRVGPRVSLIVSAGQTGAARASTGYMSEVLAETGQIDRAVAVLRPQALVGIAPDGRSLDGLLRGAVVNAKAGIVDGVDEALTRGGRWLDMAVQSTLADTSRSATAVELAIRPDIDGYTRIVNMPACNRCAVLAGKFFRWNTGFQRHPRCDCRHIPASRELAGKLVTPPTVNPETVSLAGTSTTAASRRPVPEYLMQTAPSREAAIESLRRFGYAA